jgi:hypothetical protein
MFTSSILGLLRDFAQAFLFGLLALTPMVAHSQTPLEDGESVRVMYLGNWTDGVVVAREKNKYAVEFQFANGVSRNVFDRKEVRKLCEIDTIDFARIWVSSNGKFKVEAALKSISGDKVVLVKPDLTEIEVSVESLGEKEQSQLKKFKKQFEESTKRGQTPRQIPSLPPIEDFGFLSRSSVATTVGEGTTSALGSLPSYYSNFTQSGCGFYFTRARQQLVAVIPVGGPEQLVLVTATEDNFLNSGVEFQSEAYWVSLKQKKVLGSVALTPEDMVTDYDPRSKRLVSIHRNMGSRNRGAERWITLWSLNPGDERAEALARWRVDIGDFLGTPYVKLINEHLVLAKTDKQTYVVWNTGSKQIAYSFRSASFFDAPIMLTPDRKAIVLPEDGKVSVLDAVSGDMLFSLPVSARHVSGASVDPTGSKLAALTEQNVYVWDLRSGSREPSVYPAPLIGSPFSSRLEWVDSDLLLAESHMERVLYRLSLQLPVWSYRMEVADKIMNSNILVNHVLNGLLFYVAEPDRLNGSVAVGAVKLPGPKVDELTKKIDRQSLMIMKEGTRIGIKTESLNDPTVIERWLMDKIEQNGWIYDSEAPIKMIAKMGIGESRTESYKEHGLGGKTTTVQYTPHYATLIIQQGKTIIWQTGTSTSPPMFVHAENLQSEVSKTERPQSEFFQYVLIPKQIIDPQYSRGFGVSSLGLRGIEVVSTTPPGREDDPSVDNRPQGDKKQPGN